MFRRKRFDSHQYLIYIRNQTEMPLLNLQMKFRKGRLKSSYPSKGFRASVW